MIIIHNTGTALHCTLHKPFRTILIETDLKERNVDYLTSTNNNKQFNNSILNTSWDPDKNPFSAVSISPPPPVIGVTIPQLVQILPAVGDVRVGLTLRLLLWPVERSSQVLMILLEEV